MLIVHHGRLVIERYQGEVQLPDGTHDPVGPATPLLGWSMAKSVLHAVVGMMVGDGRLRVEYSAAVPLWSEGGDPRASITVDALLAMRDGLDFSEDYVDARTSDVIEMLFGSGQHDVARFAADRPLAAAPGTRFNYSSGTSNVLSGIVARALGPGEPYKRYLRERLFEPLGMTSAEPRFDDAGTWVASSYLYATAQDFARFGLLYLRDGCWNGRRLLPPSWVDSARTPRSVDSESGSPYGMHWWVVDDGRGTFRASGYEGQSLTVCPALDLVLVRLGKTPAERYPELAEWRASVLDAFEAGTREQRGAPEANRHG